MRRLLLSLILAGVGLAVPASAVATLLPPQSIQVTGTLVSNGPFSFTIQMPGKSVGVLSALSSAANRITTEDYPYVWGGGHGQAGIASVGIKGPGYNGKRRGFDCSGAVAAVLVAGGLWPAGASVPNDANVIRELSRRGLIAPGAGVGPQEVTLYDHPGVHIFMNINGRFFGTSDGGRGANAKGGAGWLNDGAWDVGNRAFRRYHFLANALKGSTMAGSMLAFEPGPGLSLLSAFPVGAKVRVIYKTTNAGTMVAQSVTLVGESTATGTVKSVALGGTSFAVTTASGKVLSFPVTASSALAAELLGGQIIVGDTVSVSYITTPRTVLGVTVTAAPTTTTTTTTTTPTTTTPTTTTTTPTATTPTVTSPAPPPSNGGSGV
jgi:hypothetical protein